MKSSAIMQPESHKSTWIAILRDAVEAWRKQNDWSRETAAQMIVETHERAGLDRVTGIRFDPHTRDTYARMKVNADRIFRWLDDVTKDNNLLCANFIPSILLALPEQARMHATNRMLMNLGMGCRSLGTNIQFSPLELLQAMIKETAEASSAVAALVDGIDPGELEEANKQLSDAIEACARARDTVETMMKEKQ